MAKCDRNCQCNLSADAGAALEPEAVSPGEKHDSGKDRWDLLPVASVRDVIKVLGLGAEKYGAENWRHVEDARRRYYAAAMRHLTAWYYENETLDPESGLPHLAHAICCLMFLAEGGEK